MDEISYKLVEKINDEVNNSVTYKTDSLKYGLPEFWECATTQGDCEDYALTKRGRLLELGCPPDKICLVFCDVPGEGGHCVLYVETDKGGFILDNRFSGVRTPTELGYTWVSILRGKVWYTLDGWE